jgi:ketosteroid isomerase-like protein
MSIEKNVQIVKNFLAALGRRDKQGLLALSAEDIEWIIPGEDWPLAEDHWVFDITVRNGKLTNVREYVDTQALARASEMAA